MMDFDYAVITNEDADTAKDQMEQVKGFFKLSSQLFVNECKNCENDETLNMTLPMSFKSIEASVIETESEEA